MIINGLQKLSLSDYDQKISCVIFTPGCNFKCHFCHNSSLVIDFMNNLIIDEQEIFNFLENKKGKLDAVVISGGEPTLQEDLKDFIIKVRGMGFKIKLDTNGTNPSVLKDLISNKLVDYIAMDIKSDWGQLNTITNSNALLFKPKLEESISILLTSGVDYEFRTTLVNEIHNEQCIKNIANIIKGSKKYVLQKYIDSENVINKIYSPVSIEQVEKFKIILKDFVQKLETRNY